VTEKTFQKSVQYGGIALGVCVVLNIWVVMRHVEVYRDATRSEAAVQRMMLQDQILQGVVQDFSTRASGDAHITEILKKAQALATSGAIPPNQNHP